MRRAGDSHARRPFFGAGGRLRAPRRLRRLAGAHPKKQAPSPATLPSFSSGLCRVTRVLSPAGVRPASGLAPSGATRSTRQPARLATILNLRPERVRKRPWAVRGHPLNPTTRSAVRVVEPWATPA
jgi:hypothetical protein